MIINKNIKKIFRTLRKKYEHFRGLIALKIAKKHFNSNLKQSAHNLPGQLIVSLTSYTPRFSTLHHTIKCLLSQSVKADKIILWIAHNDMINLPQKIQSFQFKGLEIRTVRDLGPYKKLIPALKEFPDAFIVTADDDVYYPFVWLEKLINEYDHNNRKIVCHRAHIIKLGDDNLPLPYKNWKWGSKKVKTGERIFPTGVGGVLYPPGLLPLPETLDDSLFLKIAPNTDDLWFYWMARINGGDHKVTSYKFPLIVWPNSQKVNLASYNTGADSGLSANDEKIKNLIRHFGFP